jgi:hypothetical protein
LDSHTLFIPRSHKADKTSGDPEIETNGGYPDAFGEVCPMSTPEAKAARETSAGNVRVAQRSDLGLRVKPEEDGPDAVKSLRRRPGQLSEGLKWDAITGTSSGVPQPEPPGRRCDLIFPTASIWTWGYARVRWTAATTFSKSFLIAAVCCGGLRSGLENARARQQKLADH